MLGDSLRRT